MSYLREQTFGDLFKNSFSVYFQNFKTVFLIYALPVFPFAFLQSFFTLEGEMELMWISLVFNLFFAIMAYAAITVSLSDVCLGNKPGLLRSYKFIFGKVILKLIGTNLLQIIAIAIGFILLIIPGLVFSLWLVFVPIVVILENTSGWDALKRSKQLGKGFYMRTFGLMLILMLLSAVFGGIGGGISGAFGDAYIYLFTINAMQILVQPLVIIMLILSYYDLRSRKEAYSTDVLAEDLQR